MHGGVHASPGCCLGALVLLRHSTAAQHSAAWPEACLWTGQMHATVRPVLVPTKDVPIVLTPATAPHRHGDTPSGEL